MLSPAPSGNYGRAPHKGNRGFLVLGVVGILLNLALVLNMFAQRPVFSEEAEIISGAISKARAAMTAEWVSADAKFRDLSAKDIVIERQQLFAFYRLRVMVVATEGEVAKLPPLFASLAAANYSSRRFPIDVEVHILGKPTGLPRLEWDHGRYDVYAHRLHGNANPTLPFVMTDVWQPQSNFELGMPLTASAVLSPHWFQWVLQVIQHYAAVSKDDHFRLERAEGGAKQLLSPLSQSMSGIALGPPVAGTAANAAATTFAPSPSTTTVFTADFWKALLAQTANGVDVDDVGTTTWKTFLGAGAQLLRQKNIPQFLYPPLGKGGALACDATSTAYEGQCSVIGQLDPAALKALLHLPSSVDLIPKPQGN